MQPESSYRDAPPRCPQCAEVMDQRLLEGAQVDVCASCKGLWVDWFDGDLGAIALEVEPLSMPEREPPRPHPGAPCPRCRVPLHIEEKPNLLSLFRCGSCGGSFVPRTSFDAVAAWARGEADREAARAPSPFVRLVAVVRELLRGKP